MGSLGYRSDSRPPDTVADWEPPNLRSAVSTDVFGCNRPQEKVCSTSFHWKIDVLKHSCTVWQAPHGASHTVQGCLGGHHRCPQVPEWRARREGSPARGPQCRFPSSFTCWIGRHGMAVGNQHYNPDAGDAIIKGLWRASDAPTSSLSLPKSVRLSLHLLPMATRIVMRQSDCSSRCLSDCSSDVCRTATDEPSVVVWPPSQSAP